MNGHLHRRLFLGLCALALLAGCTLGGGSMPPEVTMELNGETYAAEQSSFCWGGACADFIYPPVVETFVPLGAGEAITLNFDRPVPDSGFLRLDLIDTFPDAESAATMRLESVESPVTWSPGVPAGNYVLSISAKWDSRGDSAYHIDVTVP